MSLAKALLAFQAEAPPLPLDGVNPHFGSRFTTLDALVGAVRPVLNKHGLSVLQMPSTLDGQPALRTVLLHESGEKLEDVMLLNAAKPDPQGQGSALTYARRYALAATLGLVADEDDDGNATRAGTGTNGATTGQRPDSETSAGSQESSRSAFVAPAPREQPGDGGDPADVVIHFGTNIGQRLGDRPPNSLKWYAETWEPRNGGSADDRRLKSAARLLSGLPVDGFPDAGGYASDDDIPFAPSVI